MIALRKMNKSHSIYFINDVSKIFNFVTPNENLKNTHNLYGQVAFTEIVYIRRVIVDNIWKYIRIQSETQKHIKNQL